MSTPMCSPPAPLGVAPWVPVAGSAAVAFPQPESFRDTSSVRNERERRNAALTHLCGEGRGEDSRLLFRTCSTVAFLLWGHAEGAQSWICCRFCPRHRSAAAAWAPTATGRVLWVLHRALAPHLGGTLRAHVALTSPGHVHGRAGIHLTSPRAGGSRWDMGSSRRCCVLNALIQVAVPCPSASSPPPVARPCPAALCPCECWEGRAHGGGRCF